MPADKWNEEGRVWEADHRLLDEKQVAKCIKPLSWLVSHGEPAHH
jgi:hypothetical protein